MFTTLKTTMVAGAAALMLSATVTGANAAVFNALTEGNGSASWDAINTSAAGSPYNYSQTTRNDLENQNLLELNLVKRALQEDGFANLNGVEALGKWEGTPLTGTGVLADEKLIDAPFDVSIDIGTGTGGVGFSISLVSPATNWDLVAILVKSGNGTVTLGQGQNSGEVVMNGARTIFVGDNIVGNTVDNVTTWAFNGLDFGAFGEGGTSPGDPNDGSLAYFYNTTAEALTGAGGGISHIVAYGVVQPIPVPAALPLLATGLIGLGIIARKRRKHMA